MYEYPRAGLRAPPGVQLEIERFRRLPVVSPAGDKTQMPLVYFLLGAGTPPYKMSKADSAYQTRPVGSQRCGNCSSAYQNVVGREFICSQIEGTIEPESWCKLWNTDRK